MTKDTYYLPVGKKQKADWEAYRKAYADHIDAVKEVAKSVGASKFCIGFGGSLVAVVFDDGVSPHPAFSAKQNRNGAHVLLSRGRSDAQKRAIAKMNEENEKLRAIYPNPDVISRAHGFIDQVSYKPADASKEYPNGSTCVSRGFHTADPVFFGMDSEIIIVYGNPNESIAHILEWRVPQGEELVFDPPSWETPEGYERISKERYEFMKAEYKLRKSEEKSKEESID